MLTFGPFRLDAETGSLWRAGEEITADLRAARELLEQTS
jgi:hypothetical protein